MDERSKKPKTSRPTPKQDSPKEDAGEPKRPMGIDNREESVRRYGNLEPEGYTRHSHGNREGEFQRGKKANTELPLEQNAPFQNSRFRKEKDKGKVADDQYGGKTYDDLPGDHDIIDDILKKPPTQGT